MLVLNLRGTGFKASPPTTVAARGQIAGKNQCLHSRKSRRSPASKALHDRKLLLNNNYHLVHHDLPHVPWFALRGVYQASRQQYLQRSGGFLVNGYSEWLKRYALTPVAHPVHRDLSSANWNFPAATGSLADKLRANFMVVVHREELHETHSSAPAERQTARQAL